MLDKKLLYSAYRLSAHHLGPNGSSKLVHGTCFHVRMNDQLFLVTNRHNVELSFSDPKYVGYKLEALEVAGYCGEDDYFEFSFEGHTMQYGIPDNSAEDVFVLALPKAPILFRRRKKLGDNKKTKEFEVTAVGIDMFADHSDLGYLSASSQIFFPSYSSHYDKNGERPVMRSGIISSDPRNDYHAEGQEPARRILLQAQSAEGASGAPVYAIMENVGILLGINAGHLIGNEPRIGPIHSGFSYCFKAECIRDAINAIVGGAVTN